MTDNGSKSAILAIPTYNEAENVELLVTGLKKVFRTIPGWRFDIVIIDDESPDKTANLVKKLQKKNSNLHLISGPKQGLGAAYTRGFEYILKNFSPDFIFQMDADLQHNPADIPRFLDQTDLGFEFIIGSRYVAGGDYPDWTFKRKMYSWGANFIARNIAGIYRVDDCTSGFRCISANFLRNLNLKKLMADGYAFQMSLLHAAKKKKIKVIEIPILFPNRKKGISKLGPKDIREFFYSAFILRFKKY